MAASVQSTTEVRNNFPENLGFGKNAKQLSAGNGSGKWIQKPILN
jgi:hypothetical protein